MNLTLRAPLPLFAFHTVRPSSQPSLLHHDRHETQQEAPTLDGALQWQREAAQSVQSPQEVNHETRPDGSEEQTMATDDGVMANSAPPSPLVTASGSGRAGSEPVAFAVSTRERTRATQKCARMCGQVSDVATATDELQHAHPANAHHARVRSPFRLWLCACECAPRGPAAGGWETSKAGQTKQPSDRVAAAHPFHSQQQGHWLGRSHLSWVRHARWSEEGRMEEVGDVLPPTFA